MLSTTQYTAEFTKLYSCFAYLLETAQKQGQNNHFVYSQFYSQCCSINVLFLGFYLMYCLWFFSNIGVKVQKAAIIKTHRINSTSIYKCGVSYFVSMCYLQFEIRECNTGTIRVSINVICVSALVHRCLLWSGSVLSMTKSVGFCTPSCPNVHHLPVRTSFR